MKNNKVLWTAAGLLGLVAIFALPATADQQILDDLIVDGSACIGLDCVNGESFGFDTLRLKENNLRLNFADTSTSASFPTNDWRIVANDSSNGGDNYLAFEDSTAGRQPFRVDAGARAHALYVDSGGDIGIGTDTPVVNIHVKDGNTPTLRLEQDGSSGFTPQTWDVAGNEANFFIRDATNGSALPFKIKPGAPTSAIFIAASTGRVGLGEETPAASLHVTESSGQAGFRLENAAATWNTANTGAGAYVINETTDGNNELTLAESGDLTVEGQLFASNCVSPTPCGPDYVFENSYELMPLDELAEFVSREKHLPNVPSAEEMVGRINVNEMQMTLLEKIEELVLYTLDQQSTIEELAADKAALAERLEKLETALAGN